MPLTRPAIPAGYRDRGSNRLRRTLLSMRARPADDCLAHRYGVGVFVGMLLVLARKAESR